MLALLLAVQVDRVVSVYDGDTFRVDVFGWPALFGMALPVRVKGVDTPEIRGACEAERALAIQARDFTAVRLIEAQHIELRALERDAFFRVLAEVRVDDEDLAQSLINAGLGLPYQERHRGWCP